MALIIEQKKSVNWTVIAAVIVIVIILGFGGYYIFFQKPELIEIVAPRELQTINVISQVDFDPMEIVNSPTFRLLRSYGQLITPSQAGRDNPFAP